MIDPTDIPDIRTSLASHTRGHATEFDMAHDTNPICQDCQRPWPCDTAQALDVVDTLQKAIDTHREEVKCCDECADAVAEDRSTADGRLWAHGTMTRAGA